MAPPTYNYFQTCNQFHVWWPFLYLQQDSPPAWTQEAYRSPCIKYSTCCPILGGGGEDWGTPHPDMAGVPPSPDLVGYPSPVLTWLGYPLPILTWPGYPPSFHVFIWFLVAPTLRAERLVWSLWCLCVSTVVSWDLKKSKTKMCFRPFWATF